MRKFPALNTDAEAEAFLDQDLSDLDFSQFKPMRFEFQPKTVRVNMRLPAEFLTAVRPQGRGRRHAISTLHPRHTGGGRWRGRRGFEWFQAARVSFLRHPHPHNAQPADGVTTKSDFAAGAPNIH